MRGIERLGRLNRNIQDVLFFNQCRGNPLFESVALQRLHYDEWLPFELADVVNRADVWVIQGRSRTSLLLKALEGMFVGGKTIGKKLYRNVTAQAGIQGQVHDSHAAVAQFAENAVVGDGLADQGLAPREDVRANSSYEDSILSPSVACLHNETLAGCADNWKVGCNKKLTAESTEKNQMVLPSEFSDDFDAP